MFKTINSMVLSVALLTGCIISDDPNVNAAATAAATAVVTTVVLYSLYDHRYYTEDYQVLPVHYRPARHVVVRRVPRVHRPVPVVRHPRPVIHRRHPRPAFRR